MGCGGSAPQVEPFPNVGSPIDILVTVAHVATSYDVKTSGIFDNKQSIKMEAKNDGLLADIMSKAMEGRPLIAAMVRIETPKAPGVGESLAMAVTGNMKHEMVQNYDMLYGAASGEPIDTFMVAVPMSSSAKVDIKPITLAKLAFSDPDPKKMMEGVNLKMYGMDVMHQTITENMRNGYRVAHMLSDSLSTNADVTLTTNKSKSDTKSIMKIVFQKSRPNLMYTAFGMFTTQMKTKLTMRYGMVLEHLDLLSELNKAGQAGWHVTSIQLKDVAVEGTGMNMKTTTSFNIALAYTDGVPVKYLVRDVNILMKVNMLGGSSCEGSPMYAITDAAAQGWSYVGQIALPPKAKGMTTTMPYRLYFMDKCNA